MSAQDINPVFDVLDERVRSDRRLDEETRIVVESALLLLRVTLLNVDQIADSLEAIARVQINQANPVYKTVSQ